MSLAYGADGPRASPARFSSAVIHQVLLLEIAGIPVSVQKIAQRAAARGERILQRFLHCLRQASASRPAQPTRRRQRMDAGPEQRLARIDVSDADDDRMVHQQLLDGDAPGARGTIQVVAVELTGKRLDAQVREQAMLLRITRLPQQASEPPRVAQAQQRLPESQVHVVVDLRRFRTGYDPQAAGHAQMNDQTAVVEVDQQVLGAPAHAAYAFAPQPGLETGRYRPSQPPVAHDQACERLPKQVRFYSAARYFDFGKLRHIGAEGMRAAGGRSHRAGAFHSSNQYCIDA